MAQVVLGIGSSHSPLLALDGEEWAHRARDDLRSKALNLSDGRWLAYPDLLAETNGRYADIATLETFRHQSAAAQRALDGLADQLEAANPDVVVIIGDDQEELYSPKNIPAIGVFYGDEVATHVPPFMKRDNVPLWAQKVAEGWAVDTIHHFPGAPKFALDLIEGLLERSVDIAACGEVSDPERAGFGHAFGFIVQRLFRRQIPIVPILLNTYYPPNVLSSTRCYAVGQALRGAIEASAENLRVAVIASGGLSHFVVDEDLDRAVIKALAEGDARFLSSIPRPALNAGSSEILNWVLAAGALEGMPLRSVEYFPIRRTPAGTGVGVAFAVWSDA